jgi:hypothetical protein
MSNDRKRRSLIFLGLTAIAILLIAVALPRLELQPGSPLPGLEGGAEALPTGVVALPPISVNTFVRAILGGILVTALLYSVFKGIKGTSWREIVGALRFMAVLGLILLVGVGLLFALSHVRISASPVAPELLPAAMRITGMELPPLPAGLIGLVWVCLGLVILLLAGWVIRWQVQRRREKDQLSLEVHDALQALKSGENVRNVIVRCYQEMSRVLQKEQGVELVESMTAQEFERLLEARDFPPTPIRQLTQLFEAARYGYRSPTSRDEQEAFDCLNAIVLYTRHEKRAR